MLALVDMAISWNVQGLGSPQKHLKVLRQLGHLKTDLALMQESQLREEDFHRLKRHWVGELLGSPSIGLLINAYSTLSDINTGL